VTMVLHDPDVGVAPLAGDRPLGNPGTWDISPDLAALAFIVAVWPTPCRRSLARLRRSLLARIFAASRRGEQPCTSRRRNAGSQRPCPGRCPCRDRAVRARYRSGSPFRQDLRRPRRRLVPLGLPSGRRVRQGKDRRRLQTSSPGSRRLASSGMSHDVGRLPVTCFHQPRQPRVPL
jgi:hypothetical protein